MKKNSKQYPKKAALIRLLIVTIFLCSVVTPLFIAWLFTEEHKASSFSLLLGAIVVIFETPYLRTLDNHLASVAFFLISLVLSRSLSPNPRYLSWLGMFSGCFLGLTVLYVLVIYVFTGFSLSLSQLLAALIFYLFGSLVNALVLSRIWYREVSAKN